MKRFSIGLSIVVLWVVSLTPASGESWQQFRGPTGQGHAQAQGLPLRWSPTDNAAWKTELPGGGWSSPIIAEGRIYLTAAVSGDSSGFALSVLGLDTATGKTVWRTDVFTQDADAPNIHRKNSHASPTPILAGNRLFVHFGHMGTACLDLNGKVIWTNNSVRYRPVHGNGGSPALVGDALVFSCDGAADPFVTALHRDTGKMLWRTPRGVEVNKKFSFCTPLVIKVKGDTQVVLPGSGAVMAYDPKNGREIWRVRYENGYSVVPRPVFAHGLVFVCSGFDRPTLFAIRPDGRGDLTDTHVAWRISQRVPHTPSPLVIGDELYMMADRGVFSCLDARTGKVHYQERVGGSHSASPLYADGNIYAQSETGEGVVLEPGKQFKVLARNKLNERTLASYAAAEGALFIRTEKHLYRLQARAK